MSKIWFFTYDEKMSEKFLNEVGIFPEESIDCILKDREIVFNTLDRKSNVILMSFVKKSGAVVEGIIHKINYDDIKKFSFIENYDIKTVDVIEKNTGINHLVYTIVGKTNLIMVSHHDLKVKDFRNMNLFSYITDVQTRLSPSYLTTYFPQASKFKVSEIKTFKKYLIRINAN